MTPPTESDRDSADSKIIQLAERAQEVIEITELEPYDGTTFVGKRIEYDGTITGYPKYLKWWRQRVERVPATIPHLFAYMCAARKRNICLIRGAPANVERQKTWRRKAGLYGGDDRGDHGYLDVPTRLFWFDADGVEMEWKADREGGVKNVVAQLGEPWASTSFVWFFSATHGLERDEHKRWTGKIIDGRMRVRIMFITERERALNEAEAKALTSIARRRIPALDRRACLTVQPNYITRPRWVEHPNRDVLGDIPTIGWIKGEKDYLTVPADLTHTAYWAKAQGHGSDIAEHPNAEAAVRGIGSDGEVRAHVKAAVQHLLRANPPPEVVSFADHSSNIIAKLRDMIAQHREEIAGNLVRNGRSEHDVDELLQHIKTSWAGWLLDRPGALKRKTIKLIKEERGEANDAPPREAIFAGVERTIVRACVKALSNESPSEHPPVILLVAPTGSRKSTLVRAAAVLYVTEHPSKTVVILVPRYELGREQIDRLREEHPNDKYIAAVWRGRHADDPESPDPQHPGKFMKMCQRDADAVMVEEAMVDVNHLCKQGRGKNAIKCPLYDGCAYQRQKQVKANIWFAAHECAVHEMPKVFGDVGWVIFDESPLDAFMFGVDINDQVELALDTLHTPLPIDSAKFGTSYSVPLYGKLVEAREELYRVLAELRVPIDFHQGVAVPRKSLMAFFDTTTNHIIKDEYPKFSEIYDKPTEETPNPPIDAIINAIIDTKFDGSYSMKQRLINARKYSPTKLPSDPNQLIDAIYGYSIQIAKHDAHDMRNLTWRGKADPKIRPDMTKEQLKVKLQEATVNSTIKKEVTLWKLIEATSNKWKQVAGTTGSCRELVEEDADFSKRYGGIQVHRGEQGQGRMIRMVGLEQLAKDWNVPTLICDATGDATLLKAIWPQLTEAEPQGWRQLPRPKSVRVFQCVDRAISKWAVAVEIKNPNSKSGKRELERRTDGARRLYAALLTKALESGGADVGVITYKSTRKWIEDNCYVPKWMKLVHWGDLTGTNALQNVRALFVIGRPLAAPEAVTQQTEALFGDYIPQREYVKRRHQGRIPIVPDAKGNNCILVDVWEHPDPMGERLRRQITEGALIQAAGRARAGLRKEDEPLDIHLWTDVPVPELGPVEPVLWSELEAALDGLMLAVGGVWLESIPDAVKAYEGLFTADGLKSARKNGKGVPSSPALAILSYQKVGERQRPQRAIALVSLPAARAWLEEKLGPLVYCEVVGRERTTA